MGCTKSKAADFPKSPSSTPETVKPSKPANVNTANGISQPKQVKSQGPKFADLYKLGKELGKGNYSTVRLAEDKSSGNLVAVKCIDEKKLTPEDKAALTIEIDILKNLEHPNIIKFYGYFHEPPSYYIVTEYVGGGELFDRIVEKEFYSEKDAQKVVRTIVEALKYCHNNGVVHRDLKPENILLTKNEKGQIDDSNIKLADFGFAKTFDESMGKGLTTSCGTPGYVAPEILQGKTYGKEVDLWSLGVILYILLCGYPPFVEEDDGQRGLFEKIKQGKYSFTPSIYWANVSETAKDLIRKLLIVDGKSRLKIEEVLAHPWLSEAASETDITNALTELRKFQARRRWKASIGAVQAAHRMSRIVQMNSAGSSDNSGKKVQMNSAASSDTSGNLKQPPSTSSTSVASS